MPFNEAIIVYFGLRHSNQTNHTLNLLKKPLVRPVKTDERESVAVEMMRTKND